MGWKLGLKGPNKLPWTPSKYWYKLEMTCQAEYVLVRIQGAKQVPSSKWMLAMFEKLGWGATLQICLIIIKMAANSLTYEPAPNVF